MKTSSVSIAWCALAAATALLVLGCSSKPAPSTTDVQHAFAAMTTGEDDASAASTFDPGNPTRTGSYSSSGGGTYTYQGSVSDGSGGTISFVFTASNITSTTFTLDASLDFSNWHDASTGYVINGTLTVDSSFSYTSSGSSAPFPESDQTAISGNLSYSGGTVTSLSLNVGESFDFTSL